MQRKREARTRVIQSLKEELAALQERLQTSERELADYAANHEIVHLEGPGDGANPALARFLAVDQNLVEADAARIAARSSLRRLESGNVDTSRQLATPTIQALSAKLSTLESELGTLLTTYGERWPAVIAKRDEIAYVRRQLDEEDQAARTSAIADAQLDFDIAESRFNMLNEAVARERNSVSKHQRAAIEYQLLRREVETTEGLHANLLESIKRSTVMAEFDAPNLQIVERGSPNTTPRSPSRTLNLALSLLMGLGLGFGIVVARDYWDRSIANLFDLESVLGLPPIGTLPLVEGDDFEWLCGPRQLLPSTRMLESRSSGQIEPVSANSDLGDSILWSDEPVLREAVLSICTSILLAQTDRELNVIAVTSAMPGEGKTTVSKLLAQALALSGKKTLLIDADLRRGSLSDSYDGGRTEGLSLLLSGNSTHLPLRSPAIPNLHVLTAGPRPPNPVALLSSQTMAKLISSSRPDFRYIVIDTPPIIGLADARIVSALADGVLLAVRAGQTGRDAVAHAWTLIEASGGRGLGVVLNGTKQEDQKFLYAYSYYN
jgi:capsular exopolysaccharide synthesis family protein